MDDELLPEFISETSDLLERINRIIDQLFTVQDKSPLLVELFRHVHTVKGGSGMLGFRNLASVAHELETYVGKMKDAPQNIQEENVLHIRNEINKMTQLLTSRDKLETEKKDVSVAENSPSPVQEQHVDEFIRVAVPRINDTMNSISEIFLVRNQMVHLMEKFKETRIELRDFLQSWELLDSSLRRGIGELERTVTSMRMMQVQGLFVRLGRMLESYKASSKKKIRLITQGESTELDKKVLDTLGEPLTHLIRNSMDHGIETLEQRKAANKPEVGTIRIAASIVGNEAVIEVSDDGKGIDGQKVLASAKSKGIDVSHVNDEASAVDLIFLPGFSTADKVTDVSGRGVGMDAVRSSVKGLGGSVQTQTKVGFGTTFTIKIPVSMSLVSVVIVNVNGLKYAIPNHDILEARQIRFDQLKRNAGKEYFQYKKGFIPCLDLRQALPATSKDHEENIREGAVVCFPYGGSVLAARMSAFEKNTETVVRPLPKYARSFPFISGVTVLPTGEPIFVLSLSQLQEYLVKKEPQNVSAA